MQVSNLEPRNRETDFKGDLKKIQAKAKLARLGSIPFSELGKLKGIILNCEQSGQLLSSVFIKLVQSKIMIQLKFSSLLDIWDVLIEIVAALHHAEGGIKRQWLIDAVEISCVSSHPSTVSLNVNILSIKRDYSFLCVEIGYSPSTGHYLRRPSF